MSAPELSPEEQRIVARFEAAPTLPEAYQPSPVVALLDQLDAAREAARDGGWPGVERMQLIDEAEPKLTAAVRAVLELANDYDDGSEWGAALFRGDVIRTAIRTAIAAALSVTP